MSLAEAFPIAHNSKAVFVDELLGLVDIDHANVNMVVWQRENGIAIQHAAANIIHTLTELNVREEVTPESAFDTLSKRIPNDVVTEPLIHDVCELIDAFCCLMGCDSVGLRLEVADRASCPRFHVDQVACRLITTYIGPATLWLAHEVVDRSKLGRGSNGLPDDESGLMTSIHDIQSIDAGDVALLKGEAWPGNQGAGIVHRSPSVNPGERRLVLTLDPIFQS